MNPSAKGWIPKFLTIANKQQHIASSCSSLVFYKKLKSTGFLYGNSSEAITDKPLSHLNLTSSEFTKINLFQSLLFTFFKKNPNKNINTAIDHIISFYKKTNHNKASFLDKFSIAKNPTDNLEQILADRISGTSFFNKKDNSIFTNTLLFVDVLSFIKFLTTTNDCKIYMENLERDLISLSFFALKSKLDKDNSDEQIIKQIETSSVYLNIQIKETTALGLETLQLKDYSDLEKEYLFDISFLAVWNDKKLDQSEHNFLLQLANKLQVSTSLIKENLEYITVFSEKYSKKIKLFEYQNPLNQIYKESTTTVKLLIERNKKRLLLELNESGELVKLLVQSTKRELTKDEKNKVKDQLLDICKTIPSLTIFLIPGGTLLLPILIKFIPSLLPSAFNENKLDS
ncbi:MAG: LETM1-related biofilm-associated protein [Flavobacteriaceae bacterium]|nr:LETM1-related biofilm-associated protein [Flavobacteriaceae bacterium]MDG1790328.1 LETM1-related biofilm-associated protein [Flavobacteriaceae bacterium]MDG2447682.1 LETM1-related biofilm-associated protein [Flavobacteriaceae bacterium]